MMEAPGLEWAGRGDLHFCIRPASGRGSTRQDAEQELRTGQEEYPARDIEIGYDDKAVYLEGVHAAERTEEDAKSEPVVKTYSDARIREREAGEVTGFAAHEPAFREHYRETYAEGEREYGHYHPAYRTGYDYGTSEQYKGRHWDAVKSDVKNDYEKHHGEGTWDRVKDAARHAFERARSHTKTGKTGSGTTKST